MELVDVDLMKTFFEYGLYGIGWGMLVIVPLEILVFGIMKAFRLLKS